MSRILRSLPALACVLVALSTTGCGVGSSESSDGVIVIPSKRPYETPGVVMGKPGERVGPLTVQVLGPVIRGEPGRNGGRDPVEVERNVKVTFKFKDDYKAFLRPKESKSEPDSDSDTDSEAETDNATEVAYDLAPRVLENLEDAAGKEELEVPVKANGFASVWVRLGKFVGSYRLEAQIDNELGVSKKVNFWLYSGVKIVPDRSQREGPSGSKIRLGVQVSRVTRAGNVKSDNDCVVWFHSEARNDPFWRSEETEDEGSARIEVSLGPRTDQHHLVAELEPKKPIAPIRGVVIDYYSINWTQITLYIFGAVLFVVVGLRLMGGGLLVALHPVLHLPTGDFTRGRLRGFLGGTAEGGLFLSSASVTSRLVHFANGGLLIATGAATQLLGAQFGKTLLLQIVAFDLIGTMAMPLLAVGTLLRIFSAPYGLRHWGSIFMGLGLVLLGWVVFLEVADIAWRSPGFTETLQDNWDPMTADGIAIPIFLRTLFYALIVSAFLRSSTLLVLPAAAFTAVGVTSPVAFISILAGADIGASIGTLVGSLRYGREARRTALSNLVFQCFGSVWLSVISWIPAAGSSIPLFVAEWLTPGKLFHPSPENVSHHLATLQTVFHLFNGVVLLAAMPLAMRLVDRILPRDPVNDDLKPYRLDPNLAEVPSLGLAQATREAVYLVELVRKTLAESFDTFRYQDLNLAEQISRRDESITTIQREISQYLMDLARNTLSKKEVSRLHILQAVVGNLVRLVKDGEALRDQTVLTIEEKVETPGAALRDLTELYDLLMSQFENVLQILENPDRRVEETAVKLGERLARSGTRIESAWMQKTTPGEVPTTAYLIAREAYRTLASATGHLAHIAERMRVLASR
jgi:phosphate:Na+ symporter